MKNEFWLNTWEKNDIPFHDSHFNKDLIKFFPEFKLDVGASILVPLCGKSLDMIWLQDQGFHVIGVELSPIACIDFFKILKVEPHISKHNNFIIYEHQNIKLICGDFFKLNRADLPTLHAIYDCKALIALPHSLRIEYASKIIELKNEKTHMLLLTIDTDCEVKSPPFPVTATEVHNLFGEKFNIQQIKREFVTTAISENLLQKGFKSLIEESYILSSK